MDDSIPTNPGEETRKQILAAAKEVFAEKGFRGATTRLIAERAGVNEVTLFRHFQTKQNLLNTVIAQYSAMPDLGKQMAQHLSGDLTADLTAFCSLLFREIVARQEVLRVMLCEAQQVPELQQVIGNIPAQLRFMLAGYFEKQIQAGKMRADLNPEVMAQALIGMFYAYGISQNLLNSPFNKTMDQNTIVAHFVAVFLDGTRSKA